MRNFDDLNEQQLQATEHTEGPLLILAGAGSGKTRVLTHRIAYLIEEKKVNPWYILAITFTNKAADEMKERVERLLPEGAGQVWVATFHSTCLRILRRFADRIGYTNQFTIYDADDQKTLMKHILKKLDLDPKQYRERSLLQAISAAKDEELTPDDLYRRGASNFMDRRIAEIYEAYEKELKSNDAMDFDDLLLKTVELFRSDAEVLGYYQERFHYIMVDEYQDTNRIQFELIRLLSGKYRNLCVVGDDDQSIYKFRGATIANILGFEEAFPGAATIRLEQNYRSVMHILESANSVIRNNTGRKEKSLWSRRGDGEPVGFTLYESGYSEAEGVAGQILELVRAGKYHYSDFAVLYRTNAQSRAFEEKCVAMGIPYRMVGGVNFYQRQEIKDILAYLKTIAGARDELAVRRIINVPRRGIGAATIEKISSFAELTGKSFFEAMEHPENIPGLGKAAGKVKAFHSQILVLRARAEYMALPELIEEILESTGYLEALEESEEEEVAGTRADNLDELKNKAADFEREHEEADLTSFLEEVALVADIDSLETDADRIILMTLHAAKGLEFPFVFLTGMEEGLFPGYLAINSGDKSDLEEERRLCYVGITRAKDRLELSAARVRTVRGQQQRNALSRFVGEIPQETLNYREEGSFVRRTRPDTVPFVQKKSPYAAGFAAASGSFGADLKENVSAPRPFPGPSFGKPFLPVRQEHLSYQTGDRVRHSRFGVGTVLEIRDGKKDYEVTVDFDTAGVKRMFAAFANLEKI